jgi:hypothetical protein
MGMENNMDFVNAIPEKPIRGMAKAGIVKAKRSGITPPKPDKPSGGVASATGGGIDALSSKELVALLVNKGLDGDMDAVNAHEDKVTRGHSQRPYRHLNLYSPIKPLVLSMIMHLFHPLSHLQLHQKACLVLVV